MPDIESDIALDDNSRRRRMMAAFVVLLIILLLISTGLLFWMSRPVGVIAQGEEAGGLEWIRSIYGWGDSADEQLLTPNDVAIGPDGTIWVTDQSRARIIAFDPDGTYNTLLHQGPIGGSEFALEMPTCIDVDEEGNIYVGELTADRITVLSPDNEVLRQYAVPEPTDIAVRGDIIVAGSRQGFVIIEKNGDVVAVVGEGGSGEDQFDSVAGLAISEDGTIFVTDRFNNRLSAYDSVGNRLWIREMGVPSNQGITTPDVSTETSAEAKMILPTRIAIDDTGRLVITDPFDFSLTVVDPENGDLIAKYGAQGSIDGKFTYPNGLSYDAERDWFAVADSANSRVQIVRLPDTGTSAMAGISRSLAGSARACILPLLLILLAIIALIAKRVVRKMRERRSDEDIPSADEIDDLGDALPMTDPV